MNHSIQRLRVSLSQALAAITLLLVVQCVQAKDSYIKLESETIDVFVGDAIIIDIEHTGLVGSPDFDQLKTLASFERESYGTRIAVIADKLVEIHVRRMEFNAGKPGIILFGPLEAEGLVSNSIAVTVSEASQSRWTSSDSDATIDFSISPQKPWLYQMVTVEIQLRHSFPIAEQSIELPAFGNFEIRAPITERRTIGPDGMRQINWRYLLFPQTSGEQSIGSIKWRGTLVKSRTERSDFKRQSDELMLSVLPAPASHSGQNTQDTDWWLPATSLSIDEQWSQDVRELKAGDEVTRVISLQASGVTAGQLPTINVLESRAIVQTLIDVERSEELSNTTINSRADFTYRVNAQSPIPVFLDTVRVPWWNTSTNTGKELIIPARRINVGLPERTDLLARLATDYQNQGTFNTLRTRLTQATENTEQRVIILLCVTAVLLLLLILPLLLGISRSSQKTARARSGMPRARKFLLVKLAKEESWDDLYIALMEQGKDAAIMRPKPRTYYQNTLEEIKTLTGQMAFSGNRELGANHGTTKNRILHQLRSI